MLFPSQIFLFLFLPLVLLIYYGVLRKTKHIKNFFLFVVSLFFYGYGAPNYLKLLLFVIVVNWFFGLLVDHYRNKKNIIHFIVAATVLVDIGVLAWYKYASFTVYNIDRLFPNLLPIPKVVLPIGISFFTFQAISYVIDVYREDGKAQKNPLNVGLYIAFFPQLIAGPIVRYETIARQIQDRKENWYDFRKGVCRFIIGLGKKVILANHMGVVADAAFSTIVGGNFPTSAMFGWLGAISYTLQIYFDFAGYSDMAIGLGRMFGFRFEENFEYPYISKSATEFWRRWHISLGTWFRDYVYIPLGGSRVKTKFRLIFNLFVVWMLTGTWHGASFSFIAWGFLYFVLLTLEKMTKFHEKLGRFAYVYAMFFVVMGWVLFRAQSLSAAVVYMKTMFGIGANSFMDAGVTAYVVQNWMYYLGAVIGSFPLVHNLDRKLRGKWYWDVLYVIALLAILVVSVTFIMNNAYNPFIYFNF